ncbi:DUF3048 domain-containing protein [Sanguibacter sp. HDW7]|uniref:DUF3048 domain-containing protein n=1 Tax=Sanguibacter sp. HDW7 TaxID=2714931 RepID=UPI001F0DF5C2|nr:DUF3048 domain-containing protein [Sanguibacter sp. HDW7]
MNRRTTRGRGAVVALVGTLVATLGLAACSKDADPQPAPPTPTVTVDASVEPTKTDAPTPEGPIVYPLTGVAVDEVPNRPAIAVKVENTAAARPQSGLEDADIVWETIVEFEVSRFIAVYQSKTPETVGPVRSARPVDLRAISPLKPLFVFSGAQSKMLGRISRAEAVQAISNDAGAAGLSRSSARRAPHNVYADLVTIWKAADSTHSAAPAQQLQYAADAKDATATVDGKSTSSIAIALSSAARPGWAWDGEADVWLRSEGSAKAMGANGKQLRATNVVLIETEQRDSKMDAQGGAPVPDQAFRGKGKALVLTGGRSIVATWTKTDDSTPFELVGKDGEPILLAPGNTWIEMLNKGKSTYTVD